MDSQSKNEYMPDVVSTPGETLLETLEAIGMSQAELATRTGRPKKTINGIIQGNVAITPETAIQLQNVLGIPARFWNNREMLYRENLALRAQRNDLEGQTSWLKQFPIKDMIGLGWIRKFPDATSQLAEVLHFFGIASPTLWKTVWMDQVSFRRSQVFEGNPYYVSTWLRQGQIQSAKIQCNPYDKAEFTKALLEIRALTADAYKDFQAIQRKMVDLCANAGVALVFVPEFPKLRVNGATYWQSGNPVIQINIRFKQDDQLWFSFFHEAGHIYMDGRKKEVFIDDDASRNSESEEKANEFAADFLIPPSDYEKFVPSGYHYSCEDIRKFAKKIGIAPGIVVGRLQHDEKIPPRNCNDLKLKLKWSQSD